jgi:Mg2+-importing ATPase
MLPPEQVPAPHDSRRAGLSEIAAAARLKRYGPNVVAHEAKHGVLTLLWRCLRNPLNLLLITLAALSLVAGDRKAAVIILIMVLLSISLAFLQERRSSRAAAQLQAMVHTTATVLRTSAQVALTAEAGAGAQEIPIHLLVPGDVVHLSAGDMVPADMRLLVAKDLFVNQASLTGEALPVEKFAGAVSVAAGDVLQLPNCCFMGTNVVSGAATGIVLLTGASAYFGNLADLIAGARADQLRPGYRALFLADDPFNFGDGTIGFRRELRELAAAVDGSGDMQFWHLVADIAFRFDTGLHGVAVAVLASVGDHANRVPGTHAPDESMVPSALWS